MKSIDIVPKAVTVYRWVTETSFSGLRGNKKWEHENQWKWTKSMPPSMFLSISFFFFIWRRLFLFSFVFVFSLNLPPFILTLFLIPQLNAIAQLSAFLQHPGASISYFMADISVSVHITFERCLSFKASGASMIDSVTSKQGLPRFENVYNRLGGKAN